MKKLKRIMILFIMMQFILFLQTVKANELSTSEKAFKEVANAYYMRGAGLQYNEAKTAGARYSPPEDATRQNANYTVCDGFATSVYKELLGITIPWSLDIITYAKEHLGEPEVVAYGEVDTNDDLIFKRCNEENCEDINPNQDNVLQYLKPGDIIKYKKDNDSHTVLIYDLIYDDSGNIKDAYIMHAWGNNRFNSKISSRRKQLTYGLNNSRHADVNGNFYYSGSISNPAKEGTIRLTTLKKFKTEGYASSFVFEKGSYYNIAILRFLTTDYEGKIRLNYHAEEYDSFGQRSKSIVNSEKKYSNAEITLSDKTKGRLNYEKLYMEKTVNVFNDSVIETGNELTYKIVIKNNSNEQYKNDLILKENISNYVIYKNGSFKVNNNIVVPTDTTYNGDGKITNIEYNIGKLDSMQEVVIEYTIKVGEDKNLIGNIIESKGTIGNIPSGTIKNKIGNNLNSEEKKELEKKFDELKKDYTGIKLINKVYNEALGIDLKLDNLAFRSEYVGYVGKLDNESNFSIKIANNGEIITEYANEYFIENGSDIYKGDKLIGKIEANGEFYIQILKNGKLDYEYVNDYIIYEFEKKNYVFRNNGLIGLIDFTEKSNSLTNRQKNIMILNEKYNYSKMVLNNYYNCLTNDDDLPYWLVDYNNESRRADTIFEENFMTGDILIYINTDDTTTNENGEYAYIYIEGRGFVGINLGNDMVSQTIDDRNEFNANYYTNPPYIYVNYKGENKELENINEEFANYQTLFGKDYYVILRPSLGFEDEIKTTPENDIETDVTSVSEKSPNTGESFKVIHLIITIIFMVGLSIFIGIRYKKIKMK